MSHRSTQAETNPYAFSDSNKRYQTFEYYCRQQYGGKCAKISLDAGFTCPNIDGKISRGGCIYCYGGSSSAIGTTISEQYAEGVEIAQRKWNVTRFIPYLQAHTNTYAPIDVLERIYSEITNLPGAVAAAIATRADCLGDDVLGLLERTAQKLPLIVELGLQSSSDITAARINRGHSYEDFVRGHAAVKALTNVKTCVHLIFGLPGETREDMLRSVEDIAVLDPDMVKLHLMYVCKNTVLAKMYESGEYVPMERETYISAVADAIELLPPQTVIARVTGDAPEDILLAPMWSRRKTAISNDIDKSLFSRNTHQGARFHAQ